MIPNAKGRVVLPGVARLAFRGPARLSRPSAPPPAGRRVPSAPMKTA